MFFLKFKTAVLSNNRFGKQALKIFQNTSFSKATVVMHFPPKKNAGCPKVQRNFPPRKDGILHRPLGCLGTPPPPSPESERAYADVTTKISRIDRLPNCLVLVLPWRAPP